MRNGEPFSKPRVRLFGEPGDAQQYLGEAYNLMYKVRQFCEASGSTVFGMQRSLPNGAVVQAAIIGNEEIVSAFPPAFSPEVVREPLPEKARWTPKGGFLFTPVDGFPEQKTRRTFENVFFHTVSYKTEEIGESETWKQLSDYDPHEVPVLPPEDENSRRVGPFFIPSKLQAGSVSWFQQRIENEGEENEKILQLVVTWDHGLSTRYRLYPSQDVSGRRTADGFVGSGQPNIYVWGHPIETKYEPKVGRQATLNVVGAAYFEKFLVIACHIDPNFFVDPEKTSDENRLEASKVDSQTLSIFYFKGGEWLLAGSYAFGPFLKAPWFFSPDGSRASAIRELGVGTSFFMMHANLALVEKDEGDFFVQASFEEQVIEHEPFYFDTFQDPDNTLLPGYSGWGEPGEWFLNGTGNAWQCGGGFLQLFVSGVDIPTYQAWAENEMQQVLFNEQNCEGGKKDAYILKSGEPLNTFLANDTDYSVGTNLVTFDWQVVWPFFATFETSGHTNAQLYRDTFQVNWNNELLRTYPRDVRGVRYVAVDYDASGVQKIASLHLEKEGGRSISPTLKVKDYLETQYRRVGPATALIIQNRVLEYDTELKGAINWSFKINDAEIYKIGGGVEEPIARKLKKKTVYNSFDPDTPINTETVSVAQSSNAALFVERGWLIELDLRNNSLIYEKEKTVQYALHPAPDYWSIQRYLGEKDEEYSHHVIINGVEVYKHDRKTELSNGYDARLFSTQLCLFPRWFDKQDGLEESFAPPFLTQGSGWLAQSNERWLSLLQGDPMPRYLRAGQLQYRFDDFIVHTSDETTRRVQNIFTGEESIQAGATVYSDCFVKERTYDLLNNLAMAHEALDHDVDPATLQIFDIKVV